MEFEYRSNQSGRFCLHCLVDGANPFGACTSPLWIWISDVQRARMAQVVVASHGRAFIRLREQSVSAEPEKAVASVSGG